MSKPEEWTRWQWSFQSHVDGEFLWRQNLMADFTVELHVEAMTREVFAR